MPLAGSDSIGVADLAAERSRLMSHWPSIPEAMPSAYTTPIAWSVPAGTVYAIAPGVPAGTRSLLCRVVHSPFTGCVTGFSGCGGRLGRMRSQEPRPGGRARAIPRLRDPC